MLTGFAASEHLSSFHSTKRDARLHLPYSGSLGSHFPTFSAVFYYMAIGTTFR
jgi:hypothetical protein